MSEIQIVPFQAGQEKLAADLHNTAFAEWLDTLERCYRYKQLTPEAVLAWTQRAANSVWIAYADGKEVGYACCETQVVSGNREFLELDFGTTHPDWGQSRIAVIPEYRRKSVATTLVRTILDNFTANGGELAIACSYNFNTAASKLLSKLGFIHRELFYFAPYSQQEPWGYDAVYAELDLTKPLKQVSLNTELIIRRVQDTDTESCVKIFRESAPFAFGSTPSHQQIEHWLSNEASEAILVAEFHGEIVGIMEFFHDDVIGIAGILPQYRKRGFGATLFYHLLRKMQSAGHRKAIGDTGIIQQEMMSMYHRFGFNVSRRLLNWVKVM